MRKRGSSEKDAERIIRCSKKEIMIAPEAKMIGVEATKTLEESRKTNKRVRAEDGRGRRRERQDKKAAVGRHNFSLGSA